MPSIMQFLRCIFLVLIGSGVIWQLNAAPYATAVSDHDFLSQQHAHFDADDVATWRHAMPANAVEGLTRAIDPDCQHATKLVVKLSQPDNANHTGPLEAHDLQLTYINQRYDNRLIGRFYSNDPVGFTASNPMMFNRYAYANNNPYKFVDPDGRTPALACVPAAAACGAAAAGAVEAIGAALIGAASIVGEIIQNAESDAPLDTLVDDLKGDKTPVPGVEGERGGLLGTPEQAEADWEKIKNTEGAEVKDENNVKLPDGHANRHTSTRPYPGGLPAGTDTIKVYKPGQSIPVYTGRYPEVKKQ